MEVGSCEAAVKASRMSCRGGLQTRQSRLDALSEADGPDRLVEAMDAAADSLGFPLVRVMIVVPTPGPSVFVIRKWGEKLILFERAIGAASELAGPYDPDVGKPERDPVLKALGCPLAPVVWDGDTHINAGHGGVRDWCAENGRHHGVTVQLPLLLDELSAPLKVIFSVQRSEPILEEDRLRVTADVALLALHAATGIKKSLAPLILSAMRAESPLTPAMRQYLIWAERGKTASETADIVGRKYSTIKNVLSQAFERLGCSNKMDAIRLARANGWL
jgi:DNA-binding CsgD family transcriptional regulator